MILLFLKINVLNIFLFGFLTELWILVTLYVVFLSLHHVLTYRKSEGKKPKYM